MPHRRGCGGAECSAGVPANVVFGGKDMQTLFMTARTGFYAVKTRVKGVGPQQVDRGVKRGSNRAIMKSTGDHPRAGW